MKKSSIKVGEMFAGVGGFNLGLRKASSKFEIVWANQYEPSRKNQFAFKIYEERFPGIHAVNEDISQLDKSKIPDIDLLVGGFPCQDYSVASSGAKGLYGKKGVLWWDIKDVIETKWPSYIFLENVDRLLTSPGVTSENPGRDFGMILKTLSELGYGVSWKMINAADYGFPQRRRRTFIFAFREDTEFKKNAIRIIGKDDEQIKNYLLTMPPFSSSLSNESISDFANLNLSIYPELSEFSDKFEIKKGFRRTGIMVNDEVYMADYMPVFRPETSLSTIIEPNAADDNLYLSSEQINKFSELKGGFQTTKVSKTGFEYKYGMGRMPFPDPLEKPARTMVTSEHTISRMSHVVKDPGNGKLRLISAQEAEMINTFPRDWTKIEGITESNRYFTMGNALVVDLVTEIGKEIKNIIISSKNNPNFKGNKKIEIINH